MKMLRREGMAGSVGDSPYPSEDPKEIARYLIRRYPDLFANQPTIIKFCEKEEEGEDESEESE